MRADVFFIPVRRGESRLSLARKSVRLLKESGLEEIFQEGQLVAVKQHFGERPDGHCVKPVVTAELVGLLKSRGAKPFITDTATLYRGRRADGQSHTETVYANGYTYEKIGAPFIPADGLRGVDGVSVAIEGKHFKKVGIAAGAYHADTALVLTHVTGHCEACLGGAIKNVGMGLAPRSGKLLQHSEAVPKHDREKCTACGACVRWCPAEAIKLVARSGRRYARIYVKKCIGCGECLAVCPEGAMTFDWSASGQALSERMVEHALGFVKIKEGQAVYVNYAVEITKNCDCGRGKEDPLLEAVGILAGTDLLACEQATVDVINEASGTDFFGELWPGHGHRIQLEYGEKIGLGSREYNLVKL